MRRSPTTTAQRAWPHAAVALLLLACTGSALAQAIAAPRRAELLHMLRQDCGSCHGLRMTGGLGPALTREALQDKPLASLAATIYHGRPGTPMPGWRAMISEDEARWMARQLLAGVEQEAR